MTSARAVRTADAARLVDATRLERPASSASSAGSVGVEVASTPVAAMARIQGATSPARRAWLDPKRCGDALGFAADAARLKYITAFVPTAAWTTTVYVHPDTSGAALEAVRQQLERVHAAASAHFGLSAKPPNVYLHPSVAALREYSCLHEPAVSYYDGAIHLAPREPKRLLLSSEDERLSWLVEDLRTSLRHEYAHHLLRSNGVTEPFWLQEGAAMDFAHDAPFHARELWRKRSIPLREMVRGPSATASPEEVTAFYAQASVMLDFLQRLCRAQPPGCGVREIVSWVQSGRVRPDALFDWVVSARASDLVRTARLPLWDDYVLHGNFSPQTHAALLGRSGTGVAKPQLPSEGR